MTVEPELVEEFVHLLLSFASRERLQLKNRQNVLLDG
jgi:hypothetical protein